MMGWNRIRLMTGLLVEVELQQESSLAARARSRGHRDPNGTLPQGHGAQGMLGGGR